MIKIESNEKYHSAKSIFFFLILVWTIVIACLSFWNGLNLRKQTTVVVRSQARSFLSIITTTRFWNASHAGVYVPVSKRNQPNPYLEIPNRDVRTEDGTLLTLINPAYMTRQIAELASGKNQVQLHLTSLKPIRPDNSPAQWEVEGLNSFLTGNDEYYSWWENKKESKQFFRYMIPLWTERSCLQCHAKQGYSEGDLRGGMSISIPSDVILRSRDANIKFAIITYLLIWILGLCGTLMAYNMIKRGIDQRESLIRQLKNALKEIKQLKGFIPICASCKNVRNDTGYWEQIEQYIKDRSEVEFSHSICPDCAKKLYPEFIKDKK